MNTHTSRTPTKPAVTQTEFDAYIAQAHQMRADYMAASLKSGLAALRGLFSHKPVAATTDTKFTAAHS